MSGDPQLAGDLDDARVTRLDWSSLELQRLLESGAAKRIAGGALALFVLFWPDRSNVVLARLVGLTLVVYGLGAVWANRAMRPFPWVGSLVASGTAAFGVLLVVAPVRTATAVGLIVGGLLVAKGLWEANRARAATRDELPWRIASASAIAAIGAFILAFPAGLLPTMTVAIACAWFAAELIAVSVLLDPARPDDVTTASTTDLVRQWFVDRPKTVEDRQRLYAELLYEGDRRQTRIVRFAMLMIFASIIASMGVVSDSTAVLVGAMLIAPLMTPLMAMALSLVMGWPTRLGQSALVALGGVLIAILIGFVIGHAEFTLVDTLANGQIVSRSNPTMVDLVIAVAAGAAGAFGVSRPDVSNALPGVAVAIALVPPLTVVGISYSQRDWHSGNGALLLFLTNALAIVVVGALMFLLLGVAPLSRAAANQHRVRTATASLVGAAALIVGALVLNGTSVATNVFEQRAAQRTVRAWLADHPDHSTVETQLNGDRVAVVLAGPVGADHPAADELAERLSSELGRQIEVDLRVRLETRASSDD